ncbi:MAG: hypothetical protein QXN23_06025 [Candidatus Caldarchaeum sp.]
MSEERLETSYRILVKDVVNGQRRYIGELEDVLADCLEERLKFAYPVSEFTRKEGYYGAWKVRFFEVPVFQLPSGRWSTIRVEVDEWEPEAGYSWSERRIYLLLR